MYKKEKVRILSLGTAVTKTREELIASNDKLQRENSNPTSKASTFSAQKAFDYIMNYESEVADQILKFMLNLKEDGTEKDPPNYVRANVKAPFGSISTSQTEMDDMRKSGI